MTERTIRIAKTPWARMRGLLGETALPPGAALLLRPCNAIHTLGMRFALDARFYNRRGELVREILNVPPGKCWIWGGWRAHAVLECSAGDPAFQGLQHLPERTEP